MFDTIIKGAQVIDGTGAPAFRADLAIKDGRLTVLPIRPNPGIECVIVDGEIVYQDGALTGKCPGRFLPH